MMGRLRGQWGTVDRSFGGTFAAFESLQLAIANARRAVRRAARGFDQAIGCGMMNGRLTGNEAQCFALFQRCTPLCVARAPVLTCSAPLLATIFILFGIGYTIDYNSMSVSYCPANLARGLYWAGSGQILTSSALEAPQERPPLISSTGGSVVVEWFSMGMWGIGEGENGRVVAYAHAAMQALTPPRSAL